jgi:hypothetical protein
MLKRIRATLDAHIDYRAAVLGASLLGAAVYWINHEHGPVLATTAALKQATYTFFVGGFIVKNNIKLALRWTQPALAISVAVMVSTLLAVGLTFLVHSLKGTPEPLLSTLPTALIGPPGFAVIAWHARKTSTSIQS